MTPLVAIGEKLRAPTLTLEDQWAILGRLRAIALNEDAESEEREGAVSLLRAMRAREDLYYRVFEDIGRALEDVSGGAPDTGSTAAPEPSPPDEPVFSSPREEMLELVKDGLANHLGIDGGSITEDMSWQELGADSLDLVELVMDAEDQLGIKIGDGEVQGLTTVGEAVDYLVAKTST
jgi:acyl carrier protein